LFSNIHSQLLKKSGEQHPLLTKTILSLESAKHKNVTIDVTFLSG